MELRRLGGDWTPTVYPYDRLMQEAAFIAYHFHWPLRQVLELEHADRRRWAEEISRINHRVNEESGAMLEV